MSAFPEMISHYAVERELGRGGMGVVYLARDTRLDRDVAIKALPAELASDGVRLERFEREAKTLAQLRHENIAAIYGVEEQDGAWYLVLEYVAGETLAERLDRGPLPLDEALELGGQIAGGLEAAHEAGVIHRDLKPGNVIVTPTGQAKVLDFGLARSEEAASSSGGLDSPTLTSPVMHSPTIAGAILGTAPYMSPEQARGRRVDKRTDIWSFGVVLYEMLTGVGPFRGETATDSIGALLHKEVEFDALPAGTPRMVRHVVRRCLERDKSRRMQAIGDARVELEEAVRVLGSGEGESELRGASRARSGWVWPAIAGALFVGLSASLVLRPAPARRVLTDDAAGAPRIVGVTRLTDIPGTEESPTISPDGKTLVFVATKDGDRDIYMQRVGGSNAINLTSDSDVDDFDPAFSPDGERIAFASAREGGGLFVMGATGENPRKISDSGFDPAWSPDGRSLVYTTSRVYVPTSRTQPASLWVVDVETRERRRLDTSNPDDDSAFEGDAVEPSWSPDGSRIAFWAVHAGQRDLHTVSAAGGDRTALTNDAAMDWNPVWAADGRSIRFLSDRGGRSGLWNIQVDASGRGVGAPIELMPGTSTIAELAASADGRFLALSELQIRATIDRVAFDPEGERFLRGRERVLQSSQAIFQSDVSADGEWFAMTTGGAQEDIVVLRTDGTLRRQLTDDVHRDRGATWSADGETLTFYSNREGPYKIFRMNRDGTGLRVVLESETDGFTTPSPSPDGRWLFVTTIDAKGNLYRVEDGEVGEKVVFEGSGTNGAQWSPDSSQVIGYDNISGMSISFVVLNIHDRTLWRPQTPEGLPIGDATSAPPDWLDDTRFLSWSATRGAFYLGDTETQTVRWIEADHGEVSDVHVAKDGTQVFLVRNNFDTHMWLVEIGE